MARSPPRHMRSSGCLSRYTSPRALGDVLESEQAALRRSFLGLAVGARLLLLCVLRGSSFFPAVGTTCRLSAAASGGSAYGKELPGPIRPRCLSMLAASKSHVAHIRVGDQFSIVMNSIRTLNCETGRFFGESERHICIVDYLASAILASFSGGCVGFPFGWRSAAMAGSWQATPSGIHIETNY
jgi:hypothetical protein